MTDSPPNPVYLFTAVRAQTDLGDMAMGDLAGKIDLHHYQLFAVEQGGGMETSYHRRPLIKANDIAALTLTSLGSGVNLYGYYMFHGGANPAGKLTSLQESIATGSPNDLPAKSYDFRAPLGGHGQERESSRKIKGLHLFIASFGSDLAAMTPYAPDKKPQGVADASLARVKLRADGDQGFVFVNNYVRKLEMPQRQGFLVKIKLPTGTLDLPRTPIDVPAKSYFILPASLDAGAGILIYSTAQLLSRLDNASDATYFFFAIRGLRTEFAFDSGSVASVNAGGGTVTHSENFIVVQNVEPGKESALHVTGKNGRTVRIVVLSRVETEQFWGVPLAGQDTALLSTTDVFAGDDWVHLRSVDASCMAALVYVPNAERDKAHAVWQELMMEVEPARLTSSGAAAAKLP